MSQPQPAPAMRPNPRQLVDFFARSLSAFQSSRDPLRVLCTLPHGGSRANSNIGDLGAEPAPRRPRGPVRSLIVLDSSFNPPTRAHAQMVRSAVRDAERGREPGGATTRVMLLLAVNNADKAPKPASFPVRLCMMEAFARELLGREGAARDAPAPQGTELHDARIEVDVAVTTMPYFHDKAGAIATSGFYGQGGDDVPEQVFLAGYDTLIRIFNPKYYGGEQDSSDGSPAARQGRETPMQAALGPFFARARLRVTTRPDDGWGGLEEQREYVRALDEGGKLDAVGGKGEWARRVDVVGGGGGADDGDMAGVSSSRARDVVRERKEDGELVRLVGEEVRAWIEREDLYRE
ncbi:cytidylyltransferase [Purpureocillium lavendulum]|uniref:Cytidylyltransferase n=1 Tax=Purpureocillium lavendulum TaxID=1247861 RepID=A0AB34FL53_9HYPO|nr:cytidylyltransferase [Purpureocillium lavendulum]